MGKRVSLKWDSQRKPVWPEQSDSKVNKEGETTSCQSHKVCQGGDFVQSVINATDGCE